MERRTVLVTGASAGIGEACAIRFAKEGWNVIITGRRQNKLESLSQKIQLDFGVEVLALVFDVGDKKETELQLSKLMGEWSRVDVLVNNAGLALGKDGIDQGDPKDWDTMIRTNVNGLLYVSHSIIPKMKELGEGHIINISSTAAKEVYPGGNVYCASKHAVDAITKGMRIDLLDFNIRVSSVSPGMVETEFSKVRFKGDENKADAVYQGFEPLYAEDVADAVFYAASRPPHVNIGDILLTCTAQANSTIVKKSN